MATRLLTPPASRPYSGDAYGWAMDQAALLRAGRWDLVDIDNVAEEIESVGKSELSALTSALEVLLHHLLKWRCQPERRGRSWALSIVEHRLRVKKVLRDNPSLEPRWNEVTAVAYRIARTRTARVLRRRLRDLPADNPFSRAEIMDEPYGEED